MASTYYARNREKILSRAKERYWSDRPFRERAIAGSKTANQLKARYLKRYGLSLEDYERMFREQNGRCAICSMEVEGKRLCVDHDHHTGKVRGLLCSLCNTALGAVRDSTELLSKAIAYLKEHRHDE